MRLLTIISVYLLVFIQAGLAKNLYLSHTLGNDSHDGLSVENPWKSISRLNDYLSEEGLLGGDSILFKRGDTWYGEMIHFLNVYGELQNPIVISAYGEGESPVINRGSMHYEWQELIEADVPGAWYASIGTGNAVLRGVVEGQSIQAKSLKRYGIDGSSMGYYDLSSLEDAVAFANEVLLSQNQFGGFGYTEGIVVRTPDGGMPVYPSTMFFGNALVIRYSTNIIVEGLLIEEGYDGIFIESSQNITIRNCEIKDVIGIGIKVAGGKHNWIQSASSRDIYILNNMIHHTGNNSIYALYTDHIVIRGNDLSHVASIPFGVGYHGDQCVTGFEHCLNVVLEYNFAHDSDSKGHFYDPNEDYGDTVRYNIVRNVRGFGAYHGGNLSIHNNLFHADTISSIILGGVWLTGPEDVWFYENIMHVPNQRSHGAGLHSYVGGGERYGESDKSGSVFYWNNVITVEREAPFWLASYQNPRTYSDHNIFFSPGQQMFQGSAQSYGSFNEFRELSGYDSHSLWLGEDTIGKTEGHILPDQLLFRLSEEWNVNGLNTPNIHEWFNRHTETVDLHDGLLLAVPFDNDSLVVVPFNSTSPVGDGVSSVFDVSENDESAQSVGTISKVGGVVGEGVRFGETGYLNFGTLHHWGASEMSVSVWIKPIDYMDSDSYKTIFYGKGTLIIYRGNNRPAFSMDGSEGKSIVYGPVLDTNWHHVVLVYSDSGDRRAHMYVDGIEYISSDIVQGGLTQNYESWNLQLSGRFNSYHKKLFQGSIDEFYLWDKRIEVEEVQYLYNGGLGRSIF
ncbi:MAG: right-handed parallel beta-helix repeat-containing protein [Fibrobacterales bacterium]